MRKRKADIYQSRTHLAATFLIIIVPFLFLFWFANFANIAINVLFQDVFTSFVRLVISYIIAAILGWLCAVSFYRGRRAIIALPIFDVLQSFPTFALLPLAIHFWGVSSQTVILFLIITIIWPIFFSIISSLKLLKNEWEEAVEIMGLDPIAYVRYFLLPASIPGLITGSVIGLGEGWEALVATEIIIGNPVGLGNFFQAYAHNPALTGLGIAGLLLIIFSINKLIWLPLLHWSHETMGE